jgi:hypothetical protein
MARRILVLLALAFAVLASGCVAYGHPDAVRYRGRSYGAHYGYGWPARTVVVERAVPVYRHRHVRPKRVPRREWVREHRHHRHDHDRDRRDWRDWRRRR